LNSIYEKIKIDLSGYDKENILNPIWVNSRGAIPRFDRGSIEIRVMDVQECPSADMAIIELVIETIKALVNEKFISLEEQMKFKTDNLVTIFDRSIIQGLKTQIDSLEFLHAFGITTPCTTKDVWQKIIDRLIASGNTALEKWKPELSVILTDGSLSDRIIKSLNGDHSQEAIKKVYRQLSGCLAQNKMFIP
jgi:carboxylate-amine ligase